MIRSASNRAERGGRGLLLVEGTLRTGRRGGRGGSLAIVAVLAVVVATVSLPSPAASQDAGEAIMVAAGQWALERLPQGSTRLDPHRSGAGTDAARLQRVARALGATLATLDETRECADALDRSTCRLGAGRLLAITAPRIEGDEARVKVYAWSPSTSSREPVTQNTWELVLRRSGSVWRVVSGG